MNISIILYIIIGIVFFLFIKWTLQDKAVQKSEDCEGQSKVLVINLKITPNYQTVNIKAVKCEINDLLTADYYVVIDTLSIGEDYSENEIAELAFIKVQRTTGKIVDTFTSYVKPYRLEKQHEHGALDDALSAKDVSERLQVAFEDAVVMGYDVKSDIGSILAMGYIAKVELHIRFLDLYDEMIKDSNEAISKNVLTMAKRYGYEKKSDNQLLDSCYACETLYRAIMTK